MFWSSSCASNLPALFFPQLYISLSWSLLLWKKSFRKTPREQNTLSLNTAGGYTYQVYILSSCLYICLHLRAKPSHPAMSHLTLLEVIFCLTYSRLYPNQSQDDKSCDIFLFTPHRFHSKRSKCKGRRGSTGGCRDNTPRAAQGNTELYPHPAFCIRHGHLAAHREERPPESSAAVSFNATCPHGPGIRGTCGERSPRGAEQEKGPGSAFLAAPRRSPAHRHGAVPLPPRCATASIWEKVSGAAARRHARVSHLRPFGRPAVRRAAFLNGYEVWSVWKHSTLTAEERTSQRSFASLTLHLGFPSSQVWNGRACLSRQYNRNAREKLIK